jgi:hypothetical protein
MSEQTTAAGVDVAALLAESLRSGLLFNSLDEPLDAYGKRIVRVILVALTRAQAEQQAEIARLTGINSKLCNNHNELLIDGTKWQHRAEAVAAERDALKAERDTLAQENATLRQQVGDWRFRYEQTEPSEGA